MGAGRPWARADKRPKVSRRLRRLVRSSLSSISRRLSSQNETEKSSPLGTFVCRGRWIKGMRGTREQGGEERTRYGTAARGDGSGQSVRINIGMELITEHESTQ